MENILNDLFDDFREKSKDIIILVDENLKPS